MRPLSELRDAAEFAHSFGQGMLRSLFLFKQGISRRMLHAAGPGNLSWNPVGIFLGKHQ